MAAGLPGGTVMLQQPGSPFALQPQPATIAAQPFALQPFPPVQLPPQGGQPHMQMYSL